MGVQQQLDAYLQRIYGSTIGSWRAWYEANTHHGCFCGAGARCSEPVDGLDRCCAAHDAGYDAQGIAAEVMWTADGFVLGRQADVDLVVCAQSTDTTAEEFRQHLIQLFSWRVGVADALLWYRAKLEEFSRWLDGALSANDPAAVDGYAWWVDSFGSEAGIDATEVAAITRDLGHEPPTGQPMEQGGTAYA
jgi:Phospholipase A2